MSKPCSRAPVERTVRPYVRVYIGDGSWYDTQDPPALWRRVVGFALIFAVTMWPLTLSLLVGVIILLIDA